MKETESKKEKQIASDYIEVHILEIPKFKRSNAGVKEKLEQWMWLFAGRKDMIEMARKENEKVDKAVKTMKVISVGPEQEELYDSIRIAEFLRKIGENKKYESGLRRGEQKGKKKWKTEGLKEGREEGRIEGRIEGRNEGRKLEKIELAKKMLQRKIDSEEVMEITGLKENEIKAIVV